MVLFYMYIEDKNETLVLLPSKTRLIPAVATQNDASPSPLAKMTLVLLLPKTEMTLKPLPKIKMFLLLLLPAAVTQFSRKRPLQKDTSSNNMFLLLLPKIKLTLLLPPKTEMALLLLPPKTKVALLLPPKIMLIHFLLPPPKTKMALLLPPKMKPAFLLLPKMKMALLLLPKMKPAVLLLPKMKEAGPPAAAQDEATGTTSKCTFFTAAQISCLVSIFIFYKHSIFK